MTDENRLNKLTARVKACLRTAGDSGSTENEKEVAMNTATMLMKKYNIDREDVEQMDDDSFDLRKVHFHKDSVLTAGSKMIYWERELGHFVVDFLGTVKHYRHTQGTLKTPLEKRNGKLIRIGTLIFYGPIEDVSFACELYRDLHQFIFNTCQWAFGSYTRGSGASFCEGFVDGLYEANKASIQKMKNDKTGTALILVGEQKELAIREASKNWLSETEGIKLTSSRGSTGVSVPDVGAYDAGKEMGASHNTSASRTRKLS